MDLAIYFEQCKQLVNNTETLSRQLLSSCSYLDSIQVPRKSFDILALYKSDYYYYYIIINATSVALVHKSVILSSHQLNLVKSSTSFGWAKGGNVTSAGWQVTLCNPIWYVSSRSGDGRPACKLLYAPFTFYLFGRVSHLNRLAISTKIAVYKTVCLSIISYCKVLHINVIYGLQKL